jgi:hypothetical protein
MSDQQILEALGMQDMSDEVKQATLLKVNAVVELRLAGLIEELLSEDQKAAFDSMKESSTPEQVFAWLGQELTQVQDMYDAALKDYIAELNERTNASLSA